jgi:hypothetical protein
MAKHAVSCIFCEDIRHETGEKVSLMGCFTKKLLVPRIPFTIQKLCAHTTIQTDPSEELKDVVIQVMFNGEEKSSSSFEASEAKDLIEENSEKSIHITSGIIIPNFLIESTGEIELIATINGVPYLAGTLQIVTH